MKATFVPGDETPDHIKTLCRVTSVEDATVTKDGETFPYLRLNILPENELLRELRSVRDGLYQIDLPAANLTANSLIAKCLLRSGIEPIGDIDLNTVFNGSTMEVDFHRIERFSPNTGETKNFWQIDRGTLEIVTGPPSQEQTAL